MAGKKYYWIRLKDDFFNLETIDWLVSQKNGCEYVVLYQKLCLLTANKNGEMSTKIGDMIVPYDANKIARDTKFNVDTVIVALELFKKLGLIYEQSDGILKIPYVEEIVGSETEYAQKKRAYREALKNNEKLLPGETMSETMSETNSDKRIEIRDKRLDNKDNIKDTEKEKSTDYLAIVNAYHETCVSLPSVRSVTDKRKRAIKARLKNYSIDDFITVFKKAQESDFLSGRSKAWKANFDWLINETNMNKVLEGNYDNKDSFTATQQTKDTEYKINGIIEL